MLVSLHVATLSLDPRDGRAVLVLEDLESGRVFPLWLGDREAAAIARFADGRPKNRMQSADLMAGIIDAVGAQVEQATITGVVSGVVQGELRLRHGDESIALLARPSDAIAMALASGAPILVEEILLDQVAARVREAEARVRPSREFAAAEPVHQSAAERWNALIGHLSTTGEQTPAVD